MYNGTITANAVTPSVNMKNRIINGNMTISQRNGTSSVTANDGIYGVDRFVTIASQSSKLTVQQDAGGVTPPVGFNDYLGYTSSSAYSVTSGDYFGIVQHIEGFNTADLNWGTANAKTVTLSFWVRSSLTGTFGGSITNSAQNRSYPFTYTINSANTWEYETITIAGDTSGTWIGATNGRGISLYFSLGMGTTYSGTAGAWAGSSFFSATGATSVVGTNGATFYITGVQLEVGSTATSFDYRPYGTELALCQRYFWVMTAAQGTASNSTNARWNVSHPWMRASPTVSATAALGVSDESTNDYTQSSASVSIQNNNASGGRYTGGNFTGMTANRAANLLTTDGAIQFSSEL
jgi:hypothetical protein